MEIKGWRAYGITVLRVAIGLGLIYHGASKVFDSAAMQGFAGYLGKLGFPAPTFFAYCAKLSEFLGGIALVLGAFTRVAAVFVLITMFVAVFIAHAGQPFPNREKALLYFFPVLTFLLTGPGPLSLDHWINPYIRKRIWSKWPQ